MSSAQDISELQTFSRRLARKSGAIIREYFRTGYEVSLKDDDSPVTIADKKAEEHMRKMITKEFPEHGIVGEEFEPYNPDAEFTWVLDPIDGTKNFICGGYAFGTLIALLQNSKPIYGVIYQPILDEMLTGDNMRCHLNGTPVKVRQCTNISDAVLLTSDPYMVAEYQNMQEFNALKELVRVYQGWGDCYGYFLLATGHVDIMVDPIMNPWDIMALIPIVRGAGGTISDYFGNDPVSGNSTVATSGTIHGRVIELLNPTKI